MNYQENCFVTAFGEDANDYLFEKALRTLENKFENARIKLENKAEHTENVKKLKKMFNF